MTKEKTTGTPLIGIADWLAQGARLEDAQTVIETVKKSKKSTIEDKVVADKMSKSIKEKRRELISKMVRKAVVYRKTNELKANEEIEKRMVLGLPSYKRIRDDIDERGVQVPIVVNDVKEVVCGISRWKACKELGIEEIPAFEGSFDVYEDMLDYAIKVNLIRRQLTDDERTNLATYLLRERGTKAVVGRPPIEGTKREIDAVEKKVNKALDKEAKSLIDKVSPKAGKVRTVDKTIEKDYKWVVGKDSYKDENFASEVGGDVVQQIGLLKSAGAEISVHIKYEVKI